MAIADRITRWGGARLSRRLGRSMPFFGVVVGLVVVGSAMRRKGVVSGAVDTGLNSVPFIGALKNTVEYLRGRDFFPDRFGHGVSGRR